MVGHLPGRGFESHPESLSFFPGNEINLLRIGFCLNTWSALLAAHGGAGGGTYMDVLVTSADVKLRL